MSTLAQAREAGLHAAGPSALLVIDVQHDFAAPEQLAEWGVSPASIRSVADAVTRCAELVEAARAAGVPVIWVELASDPATPWRASTWLRTGALDGADTPICAIDSPGAQWWGLTPREGEARVRKRTYSGFVDTELHAILQSNGTGWLAIAGLTTECCVLSTAFDAAHRDYPVVVADDATAAYTDELHAGALEILRLNVADIRSTEQVVAVWANAAVTA